MSGMHRLVPLAAFPVFRLPALSTTLQPEVHR